MKLPKFEALCKFTRRTRSTNKAMEEKNEVVDVDYIPTIESESIILMWVEEQNRK